MNPMLNCLIVLRLMTFQRLESDLLQTSNHWS